jgi:hypothetical protein
MLLFSKFAGAMLALMLAAATPSVSAALHVESALYQERTTAPGARYRGSIALRNSGNSAVSAKLYRSDYSFSADGSNRYRAPGSMARSNGAWLQLGQEQVTIPAQGTVSVSYDVVVPANKSLAGSYWSVVMIEPLSAAESSGPGAARPGQVRAAITTVTRYAVQVASNIGDSGRRALHFANPHMLKGRGVVKALTVDVDNAGERSLNPQIVLELRAGGAAPLRVAGGQRRLYPATAARFQLDLSAVPAGAYHALLTADAGGDDVFGSQFELTVD